jgi:hypothetical protein
MILMAASVILVPSIHAFSLRLNVPVSGSYKVDDCSDCSPTSSGYSIRAIFQEIFGLGIGYASNTYNFGFPGSTKWTNNADLDVPNHWKVTTNAVDLSMTASFFTVGVGNVIGGEVYGYHGKFFKQDGVTVVTLTQNTELDSISGTTSFVNFGYGIGPVDLLIGYRMWDVKYKTKYTYTLSYLGEYASGSGKNTEENEISIAAVTAGIGISF